MSVTNPITMSTIAYITANKQKRKKTEKEKKLRYKHLDKPVSAVSSSVYRGKRKSTEQKAEFPNKPWAPSNR